MIVVAITMHTCMIHQGQTFILNFAFQNLMYTYTCNKEEQVIKDTENETQKGNVTHSRKKYKISSKMSHAAGGAQNGRCTGSSSSLPSWWPSWPALHVYSSSKKRSHTQTWSYKSEDKAQLPMRKICYLS